MPKYSVDRTILEINNPGVNRMISIALSGIMFFPGKEDLQNLGFYKAAHLLNTVDCMIDFCGYSKEAAGGALILFVEQEFGSWKDFTSLLIANRMPRPGKCGAIDSLACRGHWAGEIFLKVYYDGVGVAEAVKLIKEEGFDKSYLGDISTDVGSVTKNVWAKYKLVAHLWAALCHFEIPDSLDGYIHFDMAKPKVSSGIEYGGLQGFIDVANHYYSNVVDGGVQLKRSNEKLVDSEKAWEIVFV